MPRQVTGASGRLKKWLPLTVMGLAIVIIVLDTTLLNVSLGTIVRELKTDITSIQWVITIYSLMLAALTITGGRFGDLFGRKKMFVLGAAIFALGSFIASVSPTVTWLIIGESVIEGVGAALMMPATASLLVASYQGRDRAVALGVWGGMAAAGSAIGPILGGYLTSHYSWRWGFRINVFVAALLIIGSIIIHESRDREEKPTIDWLGVLLSAGGLSSGVFAIIQGSTYGWWIAKAPFHLGNAELQFGRISVIPAFLVLSALLLTLFVFWERITTRRDRTPLVSMRLFANKQFTSGAITTAILSLGQIGLIFALPVFLQGVRGLDAFHTGIAMLPLSIAVLLFAPLGGFVGHKFVPKHIVQLGLLTNVIGLFLLRNALTVDAQVHDFILPLAVYGTGMGLGMSQLSNLTLSAVSRQEAGEASGVNNTLRQVGSSLGSAVIGAILIAAIGTNLKEGIFASHILPEASKPAIAVQAARQSSAIEFGGAVQGESMLPKPMIREIKSIANESTVKANRKALLFTIGFTSLAFIAASQLPDTKHVERSESLKETAASRPANTVSSGAV